MDKKLLFGTVYLLLSVSSVISSETIMQPFHPALQTGNAMPIDKMKVQNLHVVQKAVEGIGEHLPQQVDRYTVLTGIDGNGTRLIYTFEVDGGVRSDAALKEDGEKRMAPVIKRGICEGSKRFLQADISIRYRYLSKATRHEILRVDVNREDCK